MGTVDKQKTAQAAERVVSHSITTITEVIEKREDEGLVLADRLAAAAAALLACGVSYFFIWLTLLMALGQYDADGTATLWVGLWTWRVPIVATAVVTMFFFFRPQMAYRYFGKTVQVFEKLLTYYWTP